MNAPLNRESLRQLLAHRQAPCISLYQPTHRSFPDRQQDPIRFKNLLRQLGERLGDEASRLLQPLHALAEDQDFWNHNLDGLALFAGPDFFQLYRLQQEVAELVVVNERPHVQPLLRITQSADRYQILCLGRDSVRLLEGNRDALDEVPLAAEVPATLEQALGRELTDKGQSGFPQGYSRAGERGDSMQLEAGGAGKQTEIDKDTERYFRAVDRAILERHSRPSALPLLLAALPEQQAVFRRLSHNELLLAEGIDLSPNLLSLEELREKSWEAMQPHYLKRLERLLEQYGQSQGQGLASDQLDEIGRAIAGNRVATLLVEADRDIPGHIDADKGVSLPADAQATEANDLLDELSVGVMEHGGEVLVVPPEHMPTRSGAAAIYRF